MEIGGCHLRLNFIFFFPMGPRHQTFCGYPIVSLMLDWKSASYSFSLKKTMIDWFPSQPLLGSVKLNFDGCSLGNLGQIGIGGVIRGYLGTVLRPFSKHVKMRLVAR